MSKYQTYRKPEQKRVDKYAVHPIWRGVGCLFAIGIPIFSFFVSSWIVNMNMTMHWFVIPKGFILDIKWLQMEPLLPTKLLGTVAISFVLYVVFLLITFLSDSLMGADKLGPMDASPEEFKRRR